MLKSIFYQSFHL